MPTVALADEYEVLVAAHLLRNKGFAAKHGTILERIAPAFFGHYALRDAVSLGLAYFNKTGDQLPAAALKTDLTRLGRPEAHPQVYDGVVDSIFSTPLEVQEHVEATVFDYAKRALLEDLERQRSEYMDAGRLDDYLSAIHEIAALGATQDAQVGALMADLDELVLNPPVGMSTGFPALDRCLACYGIGPGEVFLVVGDPNIGKTMLLHHLARSAALGQGALTLVISHETSHRNTRLRLLRGATGWTRQQVLADPDGFRDYVLAKFPVPPPLVVRYAPAGPLYGPAAIKQDIDRAEQDFGMKCQLVVRDYGELAVGEVGDWKAIRKCYLQFKSLMGRLGIAGADAAQCNAAGYISNFDLTKDMDTGLRIREEAAHGAQAIIGAEVLRIREGEKGSFTFVCDRSTGRFEMREYSPDVEDHGERNTAPGGVRAETPAGADATRGAAPADGAPGAVADLARRGVRPPSDGRLDGTPG
jgi:hypothetical protein